MTKKEFNRLSPKQRNAIRKKLIAAALRRKYNPNLEAASSVYGSNQRARLEGDRSRVELRHGPRTETLHSNLGFAADKDK